MNKPAEEAFIGGLCQSFHCKVCLKTQTGKFIYSGKVIKRTWTWMLSKITEQQKKFNGINTTGERKQADKIVCSLMLWSCVSKQYHKNKSSMHLVCITTWKDKTNRRLRKRKFLLLYHWLLPLKGCLVRTANLSGSKHLIPPFLIKEESGWGTVSSLKHHNLLVLWSGLSEHNLCQLWCVVSVWPGWTPSRSFPVGGRVSVQLEIEVINVSA